MSLGSAWRNTVDGAVRISDRGLDATAAAMRRIAEKHGPRAVAITLSSPSTTAIAD